MSPLSEGYGQLKGLPKHIIIRLWTQRKKTKVCVITICELNDGVFLLRLVLYFSIQYNVKPDSTEQLSPLFTQCAFLNATGHKSGANKTRVLFIDEKTLIDSTDRRVVLTCSTHFLCRQRS